MSNYGKWTFQRLSEFTPYDIVVGLNRLFAGKTAVLTIQEHKNFCDYDGKKDDAAYCGSKLIASDYISDIETAIQYLKTEFGIEYKEGMEPLTRWMYEVPKFKEISYDPDKRRKYKYLQEGCCEIVANRIDVLKEDIRVLKDEKKFAETQYKRELAKSDQLEKDIRDILDSTPFYSGHTTWGWSKTELVEYIVNCYKEHVKSKEEEIKELKEKVEKLNKRLSNRTDVNFSFMPEMVILKDAENPENTSSYIPSNELREIFKIEPKGEIVKDSELLDWFKNYVKISERRLDRICEMEKEIESKKRGYFYLERIF